VRAKIEVAIAYASFQQSSCVPRIPPGYGK
jgi:hypothetical protein